MKASEGEGMQHFDGEIAKLVRGGARSRNRHLLRQQRHRARAGTRPVAPPRFPTHSRQHFLYHQVHGIAARPEIFRVFRRDARHIVERHATGIKPAMSRGQSACSKADGRELAGNPSRRPRLPAISSLHFATDTPSAQPDLRSPSRSIPFGRGNQSRSPGEDSNVSNRR